MLGKHHDRPLLIALLAIAFVLGLNAMVSTAEQPNQTAGNRSSKQPFDIPEWWPGIAEALASSVIAIYAIRQYREGKKSSQRQLRAYISATPTKAALLVGNKTIVAIVTTKNTGQTPAFEYQELSNLLVLPYPIRGHLDLVQEPGTDEQLIPTQVFYPDAEHANAPRLTLSDEDIAKMTTGRCGLYCFGKMNYLDAFNVPQWAEYCAVLEKDEFLDWLRRAELAPERQPVQASFKFTYGNNRASFT